MIKGTQVYHKLRYLLEMLGTEVGWGYPTSPSAPIAWVQEPDTLMGFPIGQDYMIFERAA